jgi:hypothetical protein
MVSVLNFLIVMHAQAHLFGSASLVLRFPQNFFLACSALNMHDLSFLVQANVFAFGK